MMNIYNPLTVKLVLVVGRLLNGLTLSHLCTCQREAMFAMDYTKRSLLEAKWCLVVESQVKWCLVVESQILVAECR